MHRFNVQEMNCGHCVSSITKAIMALEPGAKVNADPQTKLVEIEGQLSRDDYGKAIIDAGYELS